MAAGSDRLAPGDRRRRRRSSRTAVLRGHRGVAGGGGRAPVVLPRGVAELRGRGVAVVPHGVRLSLGGAEPLDPVRVTHLAACAAALDAPLVSEHVAFVRAGGREAGHLLPLPRSRDGAGRADRARRQRPGRAGRPARAGADRGAVRLAGRRVHRGRVPHRPAGAHRRDAAARRRQRVRQRASTAARTPRRCSTRSRWSGWRTCTSRAVPSTPRTRASTTTRTPIPSRRPSSRCWTAVRRLDAAPAVMLERDGHYPPAARAARRAGRDRRGSRPPPRHRHMTRELRVSARRVARPSTASCADRPASRAMLRGRRVHAPPPTSPLARPSWSPRSSRAVPCRRASTPTGSPWPAAPCSASARATRRRVWPLLAASLGPAWPDGLRRVRRGPRACRRAARRLGPRARAAPARRAGRRRRRRAGRARGDPAPHRRAAAHARRRLPAVRRTARGVVVQIAGRVHHLRVRDIAHPTVAARRFCR